MASVSSAQLSGKSLLSVLETRFEAGKRTQSLTRLMFCAGFGEGTNAEKIASAVLKAVEDAEASETASETNIKGGVAVVSNSALLGFLEGSPRKLYSLLNILSSSPEVGQIRVVSNFEDCPKNEFQYFGIYSANPSAEADVDVSSEGAINVAVSLAKNVSSSSSSFIEPTGANIVNLKNTNIPSAGRIIACSQSSLFPTVTEYLELFSSAIQVEVESEKLWPLQNVVYGGGL
ncbi:hypothetical protein TrCOL_g8229 [Triparma columacea]|uniref:Uncharacterized protein n=1 Tax=Triparma columacea TaxID=722753 RepID=A0A9W7G665_9STRA|nr:hypothetical protein TrCOL_g8229 [Triparma columacea]